MLWALFSIMAGLGDAVFFAYVKALHKLDTSVRLTLCSLITLPFLLFGFLFYEIPVVSFKFYIVAIVNAFIWIAAIFLLMKSLETADLSVAIPILSFTPIFLLFVSNILLGEFPNIQGLIGILIVVAGSYILNISSIKSGYFEPIKSIFMGKGLRMLIVAFLFSITASLIKIGVVLSTPAYFLFITYLSISLILTAVFFRRLIKNKNLIKLNFKYFFIIGIAVAFSELFISTALKAAIVPYAISLKRSSVIFSVLIGFLFFKEKNFKHAIMGSVIMFIGAVLITLS